jgi:hypothetical protein
VLTVLFKRRSRFRDGVAFAVVAEGFVVRNDLRIGIGL